MMTIYSIIHIIRGGITRVAVMKSLLRSCVAWRGLAALLLSLALAACAGGGGGGGGSPPTPDRTVGEFTFVEPDDGSVQLNWTNPADLKATEGIYKFTISYKAVEAPAVSRLRSRIQGLLSTIGLGDKVDESVKDAQAAGADSSWILDIDADEVLASEDNCLYSANRNQTDRDRDGVGDACDLANASIWFIPSEDSVELTWLNPLVPADAGAAREIIDYEGSTTSLGDDNLTISLSEDIDLAEAKGSITLAWTNPSEPPAGSGITGPRNITEFNVPGFFPTPYAADRAAGEHEADAEVSHSVALADVNEAARAALVPGAPFTVSLMATYNNTGTPTPVEIRTISVLISHDNKIAPANADPRFADTAASEVRIKYFNLTVTGVTSTSYTHEVILDADNLTAASLSYSSASEDGTGDIKVSYTYDASGLNSLEAYAFSLGIAYDDTSGAERRLDGSALAALSPVGFSYGNSVFLGPNADKDQLADAQDDDKDNDGLRDTIQNTEPDHDVFHNRSALAHSFEDIYKGDEAVLEDRYKRGGSASIEIDGLASNSYYEFTVRAHIREYENADLADVLGYRAPNTEIDFAYDEDQEEKGRDLAKESGIFIGENNDNDELADVLDPDDDNDRLADVDEPSGLIDGAGNELDCSKAADCDGDGLTDAEEYYIEGDPLKGAKVAEDRSYNASGTIRDCLLYQDCDNDGTDDGDDVFVVDPTQSSDTDGDGIGDSRDNCVVIHNADQADEDKDGRGDACDGGTVPVTVDEEGRAVTVGEDEEPNHIYHYRGSVAEPDLTVIPHTNNVSISWVYLYPSDADADYREANVNISDVVINWEVYNLVDNVSEWSLNDNGSVDARSDGEYKEGESDSIVWNNTGSEIDPWQSSADRGYRFSLTFFYNDAEGTNATVYGYPSLAPLNVVRLMDNEDGDEYADVVDPNDDNDALLDTHEKEQLSYNNVECRLREDCDGDEVVDAEDAFPTDPTETADSDGDRIGDNADTFVGPGTDTDGDDIADSADSCLLVANTGVDVDEDGIDDVCDVDTTVAQNLWFTPGDGSLLMTWRNPAGVGAFNITLVTSGSSPIFVIDLEASALEAGSLVANSFGHYRYGGLTNGGTYHVVVGLLNGTGGSLVGSLLGDRVNDLYGVVVGINTDGDALADDNAADPDAADPDDDNDGLLDNHTKELLMNSDGTRCSELADCDGDGTDDKDDDLPIDPNDTLDSDGDGVGNNADKFDNNPLEASDSDFDGFGDNIDNCDFAYNPQQENDDADAFGDACDMDIANANDANTEVRDDRVDSGDNTQEVITTDGKGNETRDFVSDVRLAWTNPTDLYLPKAVVQPQALNVSMFELEISKNGVRLQPAELAALNITDLAGVPLEDPTDLNETDAGQATGYWVQNLDNGTLYTFIIRASYEDYLALAAGSADPDDTELLDATIVLATVEVLTPAIAGVPVINFVQALSGEERITLSWETPDVPRGYTLEAIEVVGCQLDFNIPVCDASQGLAYREVADPNQQTDTTLDTTPQLHLPPGSSLLSGYLYNVTLNATYSHPDPQKSDEVSGEAVLVAIYPGSDTIPGPTVKTLNGEDSVDSATGFSFNWTSVDATRGNSNYEPFIRIGEGIDYYNLTIKADAYAGIAGTYDQTHTYTVDKWNELGGTIHSDAIIDPNHHVGGRFYHIELSAMYTTGQQSPISMGTAAIWPQPEGVDNVMGADSGTSFSVTWTNPADTIAAFGNINQGIDYFLVQACKRGVKPLDCSDQTRQDASTATQQTITKGLGLDFNNAYEFNVTVIYDTGQRSSSVVSSETAEIELKAQLDVAGITASGNADNSLVLDWNNPQRPEGAFGDTLTIKQFRIVPCRYMDITASSCSPQPDDEVVLSVTDPNVNGAYGSSNAYDIVSKVDPAYPYDFDITVVYDEQGSDDRLSNPVTTTMPGFQLPVNIPGVENVSVDNGFGEFTLRWDAPPDISDFTRIGKSIVMYIIELDRNNEVGIRVSGVQNAGDLRASDFTSDGGDSYTISSSRLGRFFSFGHQVYDINISVFYDTFQQSPETEIKASIGPEISAPAVIAKTRADSLDATWTHAGLADEFVNAGYTLRYYAGANCDEDWVENCGRRYNGFFTTQTPLSFGNTVGENQRSGDSKEGDLERGHWYDVLVTANYTAPDDSIRHRIDRDYGGIYPVPVSVDNVVVYSSTGHLSLSWSWPDDGTTPAFIANTSYDRKVQFIGTGADPGPTMWQTGLFGSQFSFTSSIATPLAWPGQLYNVQVRVSYDAQTVDSIAAAGNRQEVGEGVLRVQNYDPTIITDGHFGGVYPTGDAIPQARDLDAQSGKNDITVTWTEPDLTSIGSNFQDQLGYVNTGYTVTACQKNLPTSCIGPVITGSSPTQLSETNHNFARGELYTISVRANYVGKDTDQATANQTAKASSAYVEIPGSYYVNPFVMDVHKASNVMVSQSGGSIHVNFTQPSDVTAFTALEFNSLTYNLSLYDSNDRLVADTVEIPGSFSTLAAIVTGTITFTNLPATAGYYVEVRTIYPTGQFIDASSAPFSITDAGVDRDGDGLIEINNATELLLIGQALDGTNLAGKSGGCPTAGCVGYELTNDIMLTDAWLPLGDDTDATDGLCWGDGAFTGILDGNGHTISGLMIDQAANDCIGFFAQLKDTEIRNLTIEATEIIGLKNVGVLAGWAQNVVINNVHVKSQSLKGAQAVGGLVGRIHLDDGSSVVSMHAAATDLPQSVPPATTASIKHSSAHSEQITACSSAGGLVGESDGIMIEGSHAISRGIILPFDQAGEPAGIDCAGVRSLYRYQVTHHVYKSVGGLVGDGDSSLRQGEGDLWDQLYGMDGRIIINIGDYLVGDETRFPSDGVSTTTYDDLNLTSVVERATRIVSSYALSGRLVGNWKIGGLMGDGSGSILKDSYAITRNIRARLRTTGGLIGQAEGSNILRSYAISGTINASGSTTGLNDSDKANGEAGGLIGRAKGDIALQSTYALANSIIGGEEDRGDGLGSAGGLLGSRYVKDKSSKLNYMLNNSYTIFRDISGFEHRPLVGRETLDNVLLDNTYWDTNATVHAVRYSASQNKNSPLLKNRFNAVLIPSQSFVPPFAKPTVSLQDGREVTRFGAEDVPTFDDTSDIYSEWKRINCRDGTAAWDFGTNVQYPAIVCTPDEPADQRAWYSLDPLRQKLQVNTDLIDSTITTRLQ